jgi:hypothetical protein
MRLRTILLAAMLALTMSLVYVLSPLAAVYTLRQAVKSGDVAALEQKIEWPAVRASLRQSLIELQQSAAEPDPETGRRPGLWARIKASLAPGLIDGFIDRYATPEGLPEAFSMRETWHGTVRPAVGLAAPKLALADTALGDTAVDRSVSLYLRIKRAAFLSASEVEFEIADRHTPERRYVSRFQMRDFAWKLVSLRVVGAAL